MKVGVLGASGKIGRAFVEYLSREPHIKIVAGMRNIKVVPFDVSGNIATVQVDIKDTNSLGEFIEKCDVIVNCSGPSSMLAILAAKACIQNRVHMVDVSGNFELQQYLENHIETLLDHDLTFVLSAGVYPGFTELLAKYMLDRYFPGKAKLCMCFSCCELLSQNAARDYVYSIKRNQSLGMLCYKNNSVEKISKNERLDGEIKQESMFKELYPTVNPELIKLARASPGIKEMFFFNAYPDKTVMNELMAIRINALINAKSDEKTEAERLCEKFQIMTDKYGSGVKAMIFLLDEGKRHLISFEMQNSGNRISGIVAFFSVLSLGKCQKAGIVYPYEIIDTNKCMELVTKAGGILKEESR